MKNYANENGQDPINSAFEIQSLPDKLKENLNKANVFYSQEYYDYTLSRNEKMLYIYDNMYVLAIRIKTVLFLSGGICDSEPYCYDGNWTFESEKEFLTRCCKY